MPDPTTDLARTRADYASFKARGLKLDMTRGKPSPEQLSLSDGMIEFRGNRDTTTAAGEDARNYGGDLRGLPEVRALFAEVLDLPPDAIVLGDNSSLALMHDCLVWALLKGVPGSERPWSREASPAFICPVPGYDRHFGLAADLGFRLLPVPLTGQGPDLDAVEALAADPAVKGMWCVPRYSNPTGETYSDEAVRRLAGMTTGAPDFRLFWDDAYAVHHLTGRRTPLAPILDLAREAGHPDRAFCFASTSKVTLAGAGVALFASSPANVSWFLARAGRRTIGPDKLNQLRHLRFLREVANIIGDVAGRRLIIFDDIVDSATTLCSAAQALMEAGAAEVSAYITHGVLSGAAIERVNGSVLKELVVTDSIEAPSRIAAGGKSGLSAARASSGRPSAASPTRNRCRNCSTKRDNGTMTRKALSHCRRTRRPRARPRRRRVLRGW